VTPEQWALVKAHFDEWVSLDAGARGDRLAGVSDPDVRREVEELLAAHDTAGDLLERPLDVDPRDLDGVLPIGGAASTAAVLPPGARVGD
jgi:hypothetical protein